jgi:hypothetical protein
VERKPLRRDELIGGPNLVVGSGGERGGGGGGGFVGSCGGKEEERVSPVSKLSRLRKAAGEYISAAEGEARVTKKREQSGGKKRTLVNLRRNPVNRCVHTLHSNDRPESDRERADGCMRQENLQACWSVRLLDISERKEGSADVRCDCAPRSST